MTVHLTESGTLTRSKAGHMKLVLITPGKGSSGEYSEKVLKQAEADRVFGAGTLSFIDHATDGQEWERPEGSIKDLAGVLTEDAHWDDEVGGLVAEAKIFEHWRPVIESMNEFVGVSIRASGEVEEAQGGRVITRLAEARSVDFVTRAGRGGRVLSLLESERPSTLDEIAEIFRPSQTIPAPAGTGNQETDTKEAATMADTTDTSRIDEADPKKPNPFSKGGDNSGSGNGSETEVEKLRRENGELKAEIKRLKAQGAKEARRHEVAGIVEEAFENIDAPATKDALIESFTASDKDAEQIVKEAKTFADELTFAPGATGSVRGLGESRPANASESTPRTTEDIINVLEGA
ncbi:hypothetical protein [Brevibacterium sp. RIT 803]|uniref:hypothetical protein n=1 Tax=Brevibacterium sp. RIT 803 TaxID=2810210 RepID=UPI00194EF9C4|nr:hypothetical protein [Brevibacterium sp. RIT 803]MBM6588781.1 hypothetical protein [Brevibacterium sp. RIT 803]